MEQSSEKPQTSPGKHKLNGAKDGVPFSADNQPSSESKKRGWDKRKKSKELAEAILSLKFVGAKDSKLKQMMAEMFGVKEKDLTVEMMMLFRQTEKAIQKGDTFAFMAVMDRVYGKAKQHTDITTKDKELPAPVVAPAADIDYDQLSDEVLEAIWKARKPE